MGSSILSKLCGCVNSSDDHHVNLRKPHEMMANSTMVIGQYDQKHESVSSQVPFAGQSYNMEPQMSNNHHASQRYTAIDTPCLQSVGPAQNTQVAYELADPNCSMIAIAPSHNSISPSNAATIASSSYRGNTRKSVISTHDQNPSGLNYYAMNRPISIATQSVNLKNSHIDQTRPTSLQPSKRISHRNGQPLDGLSPINMQSCLAQHPPESYSQQDRKSQIISHPKNHAFEQQTSIFDIYIKGQRLGAGTFADVFQVTHRMTGDKYALKTMRKRKLRGREQVVQREVQVLLALSAHPNVVGLVAQDGFFETDDAFHLVMELCTGGELFDAIVTRGFFSERDAITVMAQVLDAITFCHAYGVVHRDLKPENLLLKDSSVESRVMVADFGLSRLAEFEDQIFLTACGTPAYCSPEIILQRGHGKPADMWSLGCITYVLLCGYIPFWAENQQGVFEEIINARFEFDKDYWSEVSDLARDFIRKLLVVDPSKRMSAEDARMHPWLLPPQMMAHDSDSSLNLVPTLKRGINRRRQFQTIVEKVVAVNRISNISHSSNAARSGSASAQVQIALQNKQQIDAALNNHSHEECDDQVEKSQYSQVPPTKMQQSDVQHSRVDSGLGIRNAHMQEQHADQIMSPKAYNSATLPPPHRDEQPELYKCFSSQYLKQELVPQDVQRDQPKVQTRANDGDRSHMPLSSAKRSPDDVLDHSLRASTPNMYGTSEFERQDLGFQTMNPSYKHHSKRPSSGSTRQSIPTHTFVHDNAASTPNDAMDPRHDVHHHVHHDQHHLQQSSNESELLPVMLDDEAGIAPVPSSTPALLELQASRAIHGTNRQMDDRTSHGYILSPTHDKDREEHVNSPMSRGGTLPYFDRVRNVNSRLTTPQSLPRNATKV